LSASGRGDEGRAASSRTVDVSESEEAQPARRMARKSDGMKEMRVMVGRGKWFQRRVVYTASFFDGGHFLVYRGNIAFDAVRATAHHVALKPLEARRSRLLGRFSGVDPGCCRIP
jgi:hypothetical protein